MKISTGNSTARATTDRIRSVPLAWIPPPGGKYCRPPGFGWYPPPKGLPGTVVAIDVTRTLSGVRASCAGVRPMMMTSEPGDGSAASPTVPIMRPG